MIPYVIVLLCCSLFVMYWEIPDKHSQERERSLPQQQKTRRRSGIEGEIQTIFRQL